LLALCDSCLFHCDAMIFDCGAVLLFKFMLCLLLLLLYLWLFVAASVTQPNYSTSEHVLKTCYRKIALWPSLCGGISAGVDVDVNRGTRACKNNVKCFYRGGKLFPFWDPLTHSRTAWEKCSQKVEFACRTAC